MQTNDSTAPEYTVRDGSHSLRFVIPTEYGTMAATMWRESNGSDIYPELSGYTVWFAFGIDDRDPDTTPLTINRISYRSSVYSWSADSDAARSRAGSNRTSVQRVDDPWGAEPTANALHTIWELTREHAERLFGNAEYRHECDILAMEYQRDQMHEKATKYLDLAQVWTARLIDALAPPRPAARID